MEQVEEGEELEFRLVLLATEEMVLLDLLISSTVSKLKTI
jgi:hypothetical protein